MDIDIYTLEKLTVNKITWEKKLTIIQILYKHIKRLIENHSFREKKRRTKETQSTRTHIRKKKERKERHKMQCIE